MGRPKSMVRLYALTRHLALEVRVCIYIHASVGCSSLVQRAPSLMRLPSACPPLFAVMPQGYPKPFYSVGPAAQCEERFGLGLADVIAASKTRVCDMPGGGGDPALQSSMDCYPFVQPHNRHRDQPWDNFCVARNFVVDFSKVPLASCPTIHNLHTMCFLITRAQLMTFLRCPSVCPLS